MNFDELGEVILDAAARALGTGAVLVEARAKRHAPVRSVFAGTPQPSPRRVKVDEDQWETEYSDYIRELDFGEVMSDRRAMIRAGLPPRSMAGVTTQHAPTWWAQRRMANLQEMLDKGEFLSRKEERQNPDQEPTTWALSSRGASEVRTKRALFSTGGHQHIGGRLRGSIHATKAVISGRSAEAWVLAGGDEAPYARFQEYGTRHNTAHPFLRPAALESQEDVAAIVGAAVRRASRTGAGRTSIEIVVRL
jgi:HK97 gp10 family phage protein